MLHGRLTVFASRPILRAIAFGDDPESGPTRSYFANREQNEMIQVV
jgi:hypothetical protein